MRVSSAAFIKRYGALSEKALSEPVTITRNGRNRLVLLSAEEFERMRRYEPAIRQRDQPQIPAGSVPAFAAVWDNPDDDGYDAL